MRILLPVIVIILSGFGKGLAQTQAAMNKKASESFKRADRELLDTHQKILQEYADDTDFLRAFETSQQQWKVFRNTELKMKYPNRAPGWYGSIHSMCISIYMTKLTKERIEKLQEWLGDTDDGDACAGSVRSIMAEETDLIEKVRDVALISLLNTLTYEKSYRTNQLSIKILTTPELMGSEVFDDDEAPKNIWIAISDFNDQPHQVLYRINQLFQPVLIAFDDTNPGNPELTLQYTTSGMPQIMKLQLSINSLKQL